MGYEAVKFFGVGPKQGKQRSERERLTMQRGEAISSRFRHYLSIDQKQLSLQGNKPEKCKVRALCASAQLPSRESSRIQ